MLLLASCDIIAFVATADGDRARKFYEETLGLRFVSDTPYALVFDAHGTMLRIAKVRELTVAPYTVLGWIVPDITTTVTSLAARGVPFQRYDGLDQDAPGIWNSPDGARVALVQRPRRQHAFRDRVFCRGLARRCSFDLRQKQPQG